MQGAFSGVLQDAVERPEEQSFEGYEKAEKPEEQQGQEALPDAVNPEETAESSEMIIVDNEQDAEIVLEAAQEALKEKEEAED